PDAARPDAAVPDAARPDAAVPDAARPDAAVPDAARPDTSASDLPSRDSPELDGASSQVTIEVNGVSYAEGRPITCLELYYRVDTMASPECRTPESFELGMYQSPVLDHWSQVDFSSYSTSDALAARDLDVNPGDRVLVQVVAHAGVDCPGVSGDRPRVLAFGCDYVDINSSQIVYGIDDLALIDTVEWNPSISSENPGPERRAFHAMAALPASGEKQEVLVVGGLRPDPSSSVETPVLTDETWIYIHPTATWKPVELSQSHPDPRAGAALAPFSYMSMSVTYHGALLFGGWGERERQVNFYNDLWFFDADQHQFVPILDQGSIVPEPRAGHAMVGLDFSFDLPGEFIRVDNSVLLYGGYQINEGNIQYFDGFWLLRNTHNGDMSYAWHRIDVTGVEIGRRAFLGMAVHHSTQEKPVIYLLGGSMEEESPVLVRCPFDLAAGDPNMSIPCESVLCQDQPTPRIQIGMFEMPTTGEESLRLMTYGGLYNFAMPELFSSTFEHEVPTTGGPASACVGAVQLTNDSDNWPSARRAYGMAALLDGQVLLFGGSQKPPSSGSAFPYLPDAESLTDEVHLYFNP
ncbi:MAG: hypothetical protein JXR83_17345, partial [Deltaproteobacteria bacterium]|nr:hypothetical protein [Deltaproteobacteria bacterium]